MTLEDAKPELKKDDPRSPKGSARSLVKPQEATHGPTSIFRSSFGSNKTSKSSSSKNIKDSPKSDKLDAGKAREKGKAATEKFMDTTNLKILDATETTLTFSLPPVSAKTVIQYKPYGADWGLEGVGGEVELTQGGEITIEDLRPAETYVVRVIVEGKPEGEELVVDTGVPGCSGSSRKKKKKRCVIM
ncbi:hypothetical protein TrLO_g1150 [Triparma laevis f. longispina]|uniref:Uncharacterized protein n=1 Tax=Triparma laevis f. longispina TaxID=1714387 RepID=A0A9W7C1B8_9STRA|nr:hypothetical protein TrLO_g1150 [Triparma laevis f. longispina]